MNARVDNRIVAWQEAYALDLPEIDAQHQVLFDLMNALWHAIIVRAPAQETLALVSELERYTIVHFTEEETFMRRAGYSRFDAHKHAHDRFVARVAEEKARIEAERIAKAQAEEELKQKQKAARDARYAARKAAKKERRRGY